MGVCERVYTLVHCALIGEQFESWPGRSDKRGPLNAGVKKSHTSASP